MSSLTTQDPGYSWEKKMEVVSRYMLLGNMRVVSEQTGVPYPSLIAWKKSDWWPEMVDQIKRQKKSKTSEHLTSIIETSLDIVQDRLENGDFFVNQKTGKVERKPVSVKDALAATTGLLQKQLQLEELVERSQKNEDTVADVLSKIAIEFKRWNKNGAQDIKYVEIVEDSNRALLDRDSGDLTNAVHDQREERLQEGSS